MKKTNFLLLFFLFILPYSFISCKGNQGPYAFQLNFNEGDEFTQIITTEMDIVQQVMGQKVKVPTQTDIRIRYKVQQANAEQYVFSAVRENIRIKTGSGILSMTIDSDKDDMFNMGRIFRAMTGTSVTVTMTKFGKVLSTEGEEAVARAIAEAVDQYIPAEHSENVRRTIETQYRSMDIQSALEQLFFYIPDQEVSVGDTWQKEVNLNNYFSVGNDTKIMFKSIQGNVAQLDVESNITTHNTQQAEWEGQNMEFTIAGTQKGTVKVNTETGLAQRIELRLDIEGSAFSNGTEISQDIQSKITILTE